jgi:tRNA threonylcarbamoyl adenosine modification protein (Sua5/YciO/YrdC/YwlC family)
MEECLARLRRGEILAGPTDTIYGLFCDPFCSEALERLLSLKGQRHSKPIPLLVADRGQARRLTTSIPSLAEKLMEAFWPGALTIVLPAARTLPEAVTGGSETVGLRQPATPYLLGIMEALGGPLTGTSANRSHEPPATTALEVLVALGPMVDAVVDGGVAARREGSTVVEVTEEGYRVLRTGVIGAESLARVLGE